MESKRESSFFIKYLAYAMVCCLLVYAAGFAVWTIFFTETGNGDNVEHIHATWLVSQGKIPYRDFFQHHNPLLWYVFAPLIKFFINPVLLLDLAHAIGIAAGFVTFWIVYKIIVRFFASPLAALCSLLILCPPYYYIFCFNYNPDTFMALCFAGGLYFLFSYFDEKKLSALCFAFELFFFAFMFTQKILIILIFLGIICLYVFFCRKTPVIDILYALILPILSLLLFMALLYNCDALKLYWLSNYPFNVVMQKYYGYNKINVMDYEMLIFSVTLAVVSLICFFRTSGINYKIISFLFIIELPLRCFYFSIAPYYLLPLMIYSSCLNSVLLEKIIKKYFVAVYLFLAVALYYATISAPHYLSVRGQDRSFANYLAKNVLPCDYVLSSYLGNQSIISKDPYYYWSMFGHIDIAGEETGIAPQASLTELTLTYLPKLIYGGPYWSSYEQNRGRNIFIQEISPEVIRQFYMPTPFPDFFILKYEYRHKNCQYNEKKREWLYAD